MSSLRIKQFFEFVKDKSAIKKILVIRDGFLGDVVLITPVLERLRYTFPTAQIDVLINENTIDILKYHPCVDQILKRKSDIVLIDEIILFSKLRRRNYDIAVIIESNSHYTLMAYLSGTKRLVGFRNKVEFLLDLPVQWVDGFHTVINNVDLVRMWTKIDHDDRTSLTLTAAEIKEAAAFLLKYGIRSDELLFCIHPGCSSPDSANQWVSLRYAELADAMIDYYGSKIIFTGIERDKKEIESIQNAMKHSSISLAGKTPVRLFIALLKRANLLIGPDTGTMHIANAVGTPVVMLTGYSDPTDTGPFDVSGRSHVVRVNLPCIGCAAKNPKPAQWEICKNIRPVYCMQLLKTDTVLNAVQEVAATLGCKKN